MFQAIKDGFQNYYNQIPNETLSAIGRSAVYSFTYSFFLGRHVNPLNLTTPLVSAGYAALASTIHAVTTPIFNYMFGNQDVYFIQEFAKLCISISLSLSLVSYATTKQINITALKQFQGLNFTALAAYFDLIPRMINCVGQQIQAPPMIAVAQYIRDALKAVGLDPQAGVNAVYLLRI